MKSDNAFEKRGKMEWRINSGEIIWSRETYKIFGIAPGNTPFSLDDFLSHVHDDDREITKRAILLSVENRVPNIFNFRFIRPDTGAELFIHSIWEFESKNSKNTAKICGTLLDVTKRGVTA